MSTGSGSAQIQCSIPVIQEDSFSTKYAYCKM